MFETFISNQLKKGRRVMFSSPDSGILQITVTDKTRYYSQQISQLKEEQLIGEFNQKMEGLTPGKWWVIKTTASRRWYVYVTKLESHIVWVNGFDPLNKWVSNTYLRLEVIKTSSPANIETEILPLLKEEAKRRGLVPGVSVKCLSNDQLYVIADDEHPRPTKPDGFWMMSVCGAGIRVLLRGEWAEPLPKEWTVEPNDNCVPHDYMLIKGETILEARNIPLPKEMATSLAAALNKEDV